jgi:hypothetical protein
MMYTVLLFCGLAQGKGCTQGQAHEKLPQIHDNLISKKMKGS